MPREPRPEHPDERAISAEDVGWVRFHAFYIANTTFIINVGDDDPDYDEFVGPPGPTLGALFSMEFTPGARPTRWLYDWVKTGVRGPVPPLPDDVPGWQAAVVRFATDLGERRLEPDLLGEIPEDDLYGLLTEWGGSPLEMVFTVLMNAMEIDERGDPVDEQWARRRAAVAICRQCEVSHGEEPPLAEWETTLWC